jgi:hypothetical protein
MHTKKYKENVSMTVKVDRPLFSDVHQLIDEAILKKKKRSKKMKVAKERYNAIPETTNGVAIPARHLEAPPRIRRVEAVEEAAPAPVAAPEPAKKRLSPAKRALRKATEEKRERVLAPKAKAPRKSRAKASDTEINPTTPKSKTDTETDRVRTPRAARTTKTVSSASKKKATRNLFSESEAEPLNPYVAMAPPPARPRGRPKKAQEEKRELESGTEYHSFTEGGALKKQLKKK